MDIREKLGFLAGLFSMEQLIKLSSQRLFLPFYHTVSDEELPHIKNLYPIRNVELFEQDLDFICQYFQSVSLQEVEAIHRNKKPLEKPVFHLTFDDGLSEIYSVIAPILEKRKISATFFINTDFVDNHILFYRFKISLLIEKINKNEFNLITIKSLLKLKNDDKKSIINALLKLNHIDEELINHLGKEMNIDFNKYVAQKKPYLSSTQIKDLIKRGFTIGSHSANHPFFKKINLTEQKKQITDSFHFLEKEFNIIYPTFSFPFSDEGVRTEFFEWIYQEKKCPLSFGISGLKHDSAAYHLHRTPLERSLDSAENIIQSEYFYYLLKSIANKNNINRL